MEEPGHEEYTVFKAYKNNDRKTYISKRKKMLDQRSDFGQKKWAVRQVITKGMSARSISEFMQKSISTIYRWTKKANGEGIHALRPKSTRPKTIHALPQEQVNQILEAHKEYSCGSERLAAIIASFLT